MPEIEINSIAEFTATLQAGIPGAPSSLVWYRGMRDAAYDLSPTLYRRKDIATFAEFSALEQKLITEFKHRSPPFVPKLPDDDLELLFLMQHYGIPTRLLDWTENPFVALFFALETSRLGGGGSDAAVWMLNPMLLNKLSLSSYSQEGILSVGDELLNGYIPKPAPRAGGNNPVALYGVHNSQRIVAQRGVFVLSATNIKPLNKIDEFQTRTDLLVKLKIPAAKKQEVFRQLFGMGITDSVIFPDLDGLAREIKTRHGF
jgi:hypothetical protein